MLRSVLARGFEHRVMVLIGAVVLMAFGVSRQRDMPVAVPPGFSPTTVQVQTEALGLWAIVAA